MWSLYTQCTKLFESAPMTYHKWLVFHPSPHCSTAPAFPQGDGEEPALPSMEERRFLGISDPETPLFDVFFVDVLNILGYEEKPLEMKAMCLR